MKQTIDFDPDTATPMPVPGSWIAWVVPRSRARRAWQWFARTVLRRRERCPTVGYARVVAVDAGLRVLAIERATSRVPRGTELYFSTWIQNEAFRV